MMTMTEKLINFWRELWPLLVVFAVMIGLAQLGQAISTNPWDQYVTKPCQAEIDAACHGPVGEDCLQSVSAACHEQADDWAAAVLTDEENDRADQAWNWGP
jgi:hypothetical protein